MENYKHFENTACEFYPCHFKGQNCLFCYCPLYWIPIDCGGRYRMLPNGIKDCSQCFKPHLPGGWEYVQQKLKEAFGYRQNKVQLEAAKISD